jgi:hypothetical protein
MVRKFNPTWVDIEPPPVYFIVVIGNEIEEIQYEQARKTWAKRAPQFSLFKRRAIVPDTIDAAEKITPLNFFKKAPNKEFKAWRDFTDSEKSVWYSHANLWHMCIEKNKPIIILESDCVLTKALDWKTFRLWEMMCFATFRNKKWAANGYYITPTAAKFLLYLLKNPIDHNVDSWIHKVCDQIGEWRFFAKHLGTPGNSTIEHTPEEIDPRFRDIPIKL